MSVLQVPRPELEAPQACSLSVVPFGRHCSSIAQQDASDHNAAPAPSSRVLSPGLPEHCGSCLLVSVVGAARQSRQRCAPPALPARGRASGRAQRQGARTEHAQAAAAAGLQRCDPWHDRRGAVRPETLAERSRLLQRMHVARPDALQGCTTLLEGSDAQCSGLVALTHARRIFAHARGIRHHSVQVHHGTSAHTVRSGA